MSDSKLILAAPLLRDHPVDVGQRTEAIIIAYLVAHGYGVLVPFGVNQRYDLVLDLGGRFVRAQCKTGRYRRGAIAFAVRSVTTNKTQNIFRGYVGDADVFLVHCPDFEPVYCVPVEQAPGTVMHLRVEPSRNGQSDRVNWARDYELPG